jgi:hypothetical protein
MFKLIQTPGFFFSPYSSRCVCEEKKGAAVSRSAVLDNRDSHSLHSFASIRKGTFQQPFLQEKPVILV